MLAGLPGGQRYPLTIPLNLQTVAVDISVKENLVAIFVGMATRLGSYALYIHVDSLIFTSNLVLMPLWLYEQRYLEQVYKVQRWLTTYIGRNRLRLRFGELKQLSTYPSALLDAPSPQASRVGKCFFVAINPALYRSVTPICVVRQTARRPS